MSKDQAPNLLMIALCDLLPDKGKSDGVAKKVRAQMEAFSQLGFNVSYVAYDSEKIYLVTEGKRLVFGKKTTTKAYKLKEKIFQYLTAYFRTVKFPAVTYIRGLGLTRHYLRYLALAEKRGCRVLSEIPTVMKLFSGGIRLKPILKYLKDRLMLCLVPSHRLCLVNTQGYRTLFGKKAIPIENGIALSGERPKQYRAPDGAIHLIAVASMEAQHGYERVLRGLAAYHKSEYFAQVPVSLHLVGEGSQTPWYRALAEQLGLDGVVFFHGRKFGAELDALFDQCDIAIGALGVYKYGYDRISSLKVKEYCLRGIPFVYAGREGSLPSHSPFCMEIPNNASDVDIPEIIRFYREAYERFPLLQEEMIRYAVTNFSYKTQFMKLFSELDMR